jgi:uncharacterized pyridoxamine 5'-phosphate oxidase family protein
MDHPSKELLAETWGHFREYQTVYFATLEEGKPRLRPVTLAHLEERWWILTGTGDAKVGQLRKCPWFELCLPLEDGDQHGYVRAKGTAGIVDDFATKALIAERCAYFKKYWEGPHDLTFTLVELRFEGLEWLRPGENKAVTFRLPENL